MEESYRRKLIHRSIIGLVIVMGVVLSGFASLWVDQFETERARDLFERSALDRIDSIERLVGRNLEIVRSLTGLFDASQSVERHEFSAFVAGILQRERSIQALAWVPRVPQPLRGKVENELRHWSGRDAGITELGADGQRAAAKSRAEYFPVVYLEPLDGNEILPGFDLASRPEHLWMLGEARDSADLTASASLQLAPDGTDEKAVLIVAPVYRGGRPIALADRRDRLTGYVLGMFRVTEWVAGEGKGPAAGGARRLETSFYLYDDREIPGSNLIVRWRNTDTVRLPPPLSRDEAVTGEHLQHTFMVAGRPWTVVVRPAWGVYGAAAPWAPWAALVTGLLLSAALGAYLRAVLTRTRLVEALVEERTALAEARAVIIEERDQRLRGIVEGSPEGIVTLDGAGVVQSLNPAAQRIFHSDAAHLLGDPFARLLGSDPSAQELRAAIALWCETGEPGLAGVRREVTGRRYDGSRFPMEVAFARSRVDDHVVPTVFVSDLTQRRLLERELERFFTLSLEMLAIAGIDGRFQRCNPAWKAVLGYTPEEMQAQSFLSFVHPDDRAKTLAESTKLVRGGHTTLSFENRCRCKDGSFRVLTWNAASSVEDGQIYVAARDITEQRRQMERIELQSTALNAAANAIVITDADGRINWINPAFTRLTGYSEQEALGRTPSILKSNAQDQRFYSHLWRTIQQGRVWQGELINRRKDGSDYAEGQTITPVIGANGEISAFIGIKEDITARKESERQMVQAQQMLKEANLRLREVDRLKSMFIASMSHELRTPLNSIIGFTGVILQGLAGELNATQQDQLQRVYGAAKHLLALISDIIDISKIEADKIEVYPEEFDLVPVVREAVSNVEQQALAKGLTLRMQLPSALPACSDRRRVLQCILNLMSNAVKYTLAGEVSVSAAAVGDDLEIRVSDTGIGISEHDLGSLFEPFTRFDSELRLRVPGTGLGLYLTRKITTELLAGEVRADSQTGRGSTFTLRIKRRLVDQPYREEPTYENGTGH